MVSINDHDPKVIIKDFKGIYSRPESDSEIPIDHAYTMNNYDFTDNSIRERPDFKRVLDLGHEPVYIEEFIRSTGGRSWILLDDTGAFWHTLTGANIMVVVGATGFSMVCIADRAYITPHNYVTGIVSQVVYVYYFDTITASWVCRQAGGAAPISAATAAATGAAGNVSQGNHIIRFAYEYDTGYISPFSNAITYNATDSVHGIQLNNIPGGGPYIVAVHICVSPFLGTAWDLNPDNAEMFFLTRVGVTAPYPNFNLAINFYDSALVSSADRLFDVRTFIPAGLGLTFYKNRLCIWGMHPNSLPYGSVIFSDPSDYENFDQVDGLYSVNPADGGARNISVCQEYRGTLYINKRGKTYATTDNGDEPINWDTPILVDGAIGTQAVNGFAKMDAGETSIHKESLLVADWAGLFLFQGAYVDPDHPLTWKIQYLWANIVISQPSSAQIQIKIQPTTQKIYIMSGPASNILVGDYSRGLNYQTIRWTWYSPPAGFGIGYTNLLIEPLNSVTNNDTSGLLITYQGSQILYRLKSYLGSVGTDEDYGDLELLYVSGYRIIPSPDASPQHLGAIRVVWGMNILFFGPNTFLLTIFNYMGDTVFLGPTNYTFTQVFPGGGLNNIISTQQADLNLDSFNFSIVANKNSRIKQIILYMQDIAEVTPF